MCNNSAERPTIAIVGNTFPVREELRAMGCEWDRRAQLWYAPKDKAAAAQKLVSSYRRRAAAVAAGSAANE
jgi:hypothetical protein